MTNPANIIVDEICEICDKYFATEFGYSAETNAALSQIREALDLDLDVEVRLLQGIEREDRSNSEFAPTLKGCVYGVACEPTEPKLSSAFLDLVEECQKAVGFAEAEDFAWELAKYAEEELARFGTDSALTSINGSCGFTRETILVDGTVCGRSSWDGSPAETQFYVPTERTENGPAPCRILAFGEMYEA